MAAKYAIATGDWTSDTIWSTTDGGANDTTKPTAADDVFLTATSGAITVTIKTGSVCRSLDCNGFTGSLGMDASTTLTIGDGTAGAGNRALRLSSGMTTPFASALRTIKFISTAADVQTITTAGKEMCLIDFESSGAGSWQLADAFSSTTGNTTFTLTNGELDFNGQTVTLQRFISSNAFTRTLTLGASNITILQGGLTAWDTTTSTNLTIPANTATITLSGGTGTIFNGGSKDYNGASVVMSGAGIATMSGSNTFANFTRTGTAAKTDTLTVGNSFVCTGTFTCNGNSATNRVLVQSNTVGTARTITAATVTVTNSDFQDITGAGAGSWDLSAITGNSGDCGGNSGITFTTAATQTATMSSNSNWDNAAIWTSRVPLPQDNVSMASVTGGTLSTNGVPRLGKDIDCTGATGSFTWSPNIASFSIYGSLTLISGMTFSTLNNVTFAGRGTHTLTSAGKQYGGAVSITAPSGTYTLQDALSCVSSFALNNGTFDANNFDVTAAAFNITGSTTRGLTMGSGTWTPTNTGAVTVWNLATTTGLTFSGASSTIALSGAGTNTRTFAGGGLTYGTLTHTVAGSTGELNITGSNSFAQINFSDTDNQRALKFTAGTTTTIRNANGFNVQGTSGKLMFVGSITASGHTLSSANLQSCNYISVSRSTAQGGGSWYAGANSTDGGNNSGWIFTNAPSSGGTGGGSPNMASLQNLLNLRSL